MQNNQDPWKLYPLAANLPCVTSGFIKVGQAMFCLAWKHAIEPSSNASVVYNAMGPDITTVLLSTNATEVVAVEREPVRASILQELLAYSQTIYHPKMTLHYPQSMIDLIPAELRYDAEVRLSTRLEKGFWNIDEIYRYGLETCILIELIMLGVNLNTVRIKKEGENEASIKFDWNYPGEKARQRIIKYIAHNFNELLSAKRQTLYNGFYEKGRNWPNATDILARLPIKQDGFVLIGKGSGDLMQEESLELRGRAALGQSFAEVRLPQYYQWQAYQAFRRTSTSMYGWDMWGAKKR